jgi:DNA primase
MANIYSDHLIEEIKQASDIVEVLSEFLRLKKRGANYLCNCPFHNEKTPSFSVSPSKQIYHCFGCGKGGNVYTFLMEHESLSFIEAVKFLAKRAGIKLPERKISAEEKSRFDQLFYANQVAKNFFKQQLWETEDGHRVLKYLKQKRNLTDKTINHFELGLAPDAWDKLIQHASDKSLSEEDLLKAGLVIRREDASGCYDRFRRRLMFPILNFTGKTIAFGGRALSKEDKAKYMNSPETDLYNKSRILYGLNYARTHIREKQEAIMVEGYMDFLTLWQAGFENVVASSGTAFTRDQANLIARYAPTAIMLFDSDQAGITAAKRCAPHLMNAELDFKVVLLPADEDPDSYIKSNGPDKMAEKIENSLSFPKFIFVTLEPPWNNSSPRQKEITLRELVDISALSDSVIRRELFLKEVAKVFDIELTTLKIELTKSIKKTAHKEQSRPIETAEPAGWQMQFQIISVLLENPNLLEKAMLDISEKDFSDPVIQAVYKNMLALRDNIANLEPAFLIDHTEDLDQQNLISKASNTDLGTADTERMFSELAGRLKQLNYDSKCKDLITKIKSAEKEDNRELAERYMTELNQLSEEFSSGRD